MNKKNKRMQNLFQHLQNDQKSVFYTTTRLNKSILKKAKKAVCDKDKVFVNLYEQLEDKDFYKNGNLSPVTPFVDKRTNIDRSTLYSFSKPFEALQADIDDLRFLAKSAVDLKSWLLLADLFTSKTYFFPVKNRNLLPKEIEVFYNEIQPKSTGKMRLQTDLEFNQNRIKQKNLMMTCIIQKFEAVKLLLHSKKLGNLKRYY